MNNNIKQNPQQNDFEVEYRTITVTDPFTFESTTHSIPVIKTYSVNNPNNPDSSDEAWKYTVDSLSGNSDGFVIISDSNLELELADLNITIPTDDSQPQIGTEKSDMQKAIEAYERAKKSIK